MANPTMVTVKLDTTEVVKTLDDFRTQMLEELGNEFVAGMNRAFDICIATLDGTKNNSEIANSQFGPGISVAADTLKDLRVEAVRPYIEANRNAIKNTANNTATETHTGDTNNG